MIIDTLIQMGWLSECCSAKIQDDVHAHSKDVAELTPTVDSTPAPVETPMVE